MGFYLVELGCSAFKKTPFYPKSCVFALHQNSPHLPPNNRLCWVEELTAVGAAKVHLLLKCRITPHIFDCKPQTIKEAKSETYMFLPKTFRSFTHFVGTANFIAYRRTASSVLFPLPPKID